jgi:hypothetical protein
LNCQQSLVLGDGHRTEQTGVFFRVGFSAIIAAIALQTITVLPKLAALLAALWAFHAVKLQQAVAVCQGETEGLCRSLNDETAANLQTGGVI